MLRISRGPCLAPGRFVVPPSHGTPTSAMSSFFGSRSTGSRMNVATSPKRGIARPERGSGNLSDIAWQYRPCRRAGEGLARHALVCAMLNGKKPGKVRGGTMFTTEVLYGMNILALAGFVTMGVGM